MDESPSRVGLLYGMALVLTVSKAWILLTVSKAAPC